MSADETPDPSLASVGYRSPPVDHRFQKGVSGNPRGRPRKDNRAKQRSANVTHIEDLILIEALRPIQVRENEKIVEMPMIQAVLRGMGVAAVKGSHKAQMALTQMVKATQDKQHATNLELFKTFFEYKEKWLEELEACDRAGRPRPEPLPHPEDIVLDVSRGTVTFNGPVSREAKADWDRMFAIRRANLKEIEECRRQLRRPGKHKKILEDDLKFAERVVEDIDGLFPEEATRRAAGFDLETWREKNGVLERHKRDQANRRRARTAK